ncbi:helix-turn-helix transcriptional regulator [Streptomyces clavuligerus]|uniref:Putative erythropoiesis-stimulating protein n=11 Tax=Streptomyces clavuligerus TaxID=1901 RepID=B5GNM3_STRCL|nr:LuxR C-terminal-related transcriptional regulator [Streptomyces clavuligerus]ANW18745.1 helix-turn-helix transcriptional regulator [Streptomyces clavuligerus]AXU13312.1 helix-turn-helix transcriptional regulator [Streptomyces clavuligerus]EDY47845.1 erythropoiesis-stimulating protein [Streptomyces clavuligerus]EFG08581.1 Putative erythropoiesis-stimulating protein [Streptomyces clavuligerus]MBY6303264.1 helix-turn-helix transcriptional regulator [Streptomyces clavuligerus]
MLTGLGLSAAAESVYRAMLLHPRAGVAAIAATTGDSEAEVREALDELSELALVRASAEDEGRLRVVSPDIGMEILMARRQAELAAEQQRLEASRAAAAQLISEYAELRPATPHPGVEQLIGLDAVRDRLVVLTRELKEELMAFSPDSALTESAITSSRPLNEELLARGVRMRTIYLDSVRNSRPSIEHANWLAELGGQVRTVAALPTRMLIVDRGTAVIPVSSDNTAAGAVVLTGQGMLTALCALFEATWAAAHPLAESTTRDPHGLTPQQSVALHLLADGHTDDSVAKRLGVSPRTARRMANDLMERLEARSRFEAGVRAVQRGWLPNEE